jgi:hypothetical protein
VIEAASARGIDADTVGLGHAAAPHVSSGAFGLAGSAESEQARDEADGPAGERG